MIQINNQWRIMKSMQNVRDGINGITFQYDREDRSLKAIEAIYMLVCSRDSWSLSKMEKTKLGKAFIDIAEWYGETAPSCYSNFRKEE
jgi:hypothetical protein